MKALQFFAFMATFAAVGAAHAGAPPVGEWNFRALLDGKPIGQHRFSVSAAGEERKVTSEANFAVKFFGVTAYRYRHKATEQWRGDCLTALAATTDDDGKSNKVHAALDGESFDIIDGTHPTLSLKGCVMSFAYWNPAIQMQSRLLNAQTGKLEAVQVSRIGAGSVEVRGQPVAATQFRITGPMAPIDVWYSAQGEWVGLDSIVGGGRKLSYRLQ
jgi:Family of unknown function (DUF6134)